MQRTPPVKNGWDVRLHAKRVAPPGGKAPRLGTNPLAIGVPRAEGPLVLDFGTSATAEGKVRVRKLAGQLCNAESGMGRTLGRFPPFKTGTSPSFGNHGGPHAGQIRGERQEQDSRLDPT
jgi:hypothetical protein